MSGLEVVSANSVSNSSNKGVGAGCPAGKRVLGGGGSISGSVTGIAITSTRPLGESWRAEAAEINANANNWQVTAYALCASVG